jgi:Fe-S cluster assembly protein SufB
LISAKKEEPEWMLEWRLDAYQALAEDGRADLGAVSYPKIDFRTSIITRRPRARPARSRSTMSIRNCCATYEKLGIPLREQEILAGVQQQGEPKIAVDAVFDSVSVVTTFKEELAKAGVIFCRSRKPCASIRNW